MSESGQYESKRVMSNRLVHVFRVLRKQAKRGMKKKTSELMIYTHVCVASQIQKWAPLTSSLASPLAGTAHRGGSTTGRVVLTCCLLTSAVMLESCESSECEMEMASCDGFKLSPFKKGAVLERSQVLGEGECVEAGGEGAPCLLKSFVVTFSCAPRGMAPQRLTLTVIFPIARGMMMGIS